MRTWCCGSRLGNTSTLSGLLSLVGELHLEERKVLTSGEQTRFELLHTNLQWQRCIFSRLSAALETQCSSAPPCPGRSPSPSWLGWDGLTHLPPPRYSMSNNCQVEKYFKAAALVDLVLPRMLELNTIQADDAAGVMMSVLQVREMSCNVLPQGQTLQYMYVSGFPRDGSS